MIEIQTIKKKPYSFLYFNPYKNNIHFTSAALTFVEILVHEQTEMKPNFPNESHFNIL